jgi:hypothetical protein
MAAYFIELNSQIYLKITGNTTSVYFNAYEDASNGYNLNINLNQLITISKDAGAGGAIYNTGVSVAVNPGDLLLVTGNNHLGNTYTPTDTNYLLCVGNTVLVAQGGIRAYPSITPPNSLSVKYNGVWKNAKSVYTKVGGTWRQCEKVWNNVGGTWRLSYEVPTSDCVNMLELLDDSLDFAVQVVAEN